MLGNESDALDATQDALVAVIKALHSFDGRSSFATWIYRIATNTCIDEIRRRRRRPLTGLAADVAETVGGAGAGAGAGVGVGVGGAGAAGAHVAGMVGSQVGSGRDPADIVAARTDIDRALVSLGVEFRTAVVLRDVCDLPYDEIAEILGVPVGTVRSRIARARTALAATWDTDTDTTVGPRQPGETEGENAGNHSSPSDVTRPDSITEQSPPNRQSRKPGGEDLIR